MLDRCDGKADAVETPLGYEPKAEDIDVTGLDLSSEKIEKLLKVDKEAWKEEIKGIEEFYSQFPWLPKEVRDSFDKLKSEVEKM